MSSNLLYHTMGAVPFFTKFPITDVAATAPLIPIPQQQEASMFLKFKRKIGVAAPAPPPPVIPKSFKGDPTNNQGIVKKDTRIGFTTLSPDPDASLVTSQRCGQATKWLVRMGDPTAAAAANALPTYFLPYSDDRNYRCTLVDHQGLAAALFATPIVDGCSIYVEGTRLAPTVYHINARGTVAPQTSANPDENHILKMRAAAKVMDARFRGDALKLPGGAANLPKHVRLGVNLLTPGKVQDADYMLRSTTDIQAFEATLPALLASNKAPRSLKGQLVNGMTLLGTKGTVFGVLGGGGWTLYIQRKALVKYFYVSALPHVKPVELGMQWLVRDVCEFWPNAVVGSQLNAFM